MIEIEQHIRKRQVAEKLNISISTIDRLRKNDPTFPKGKKPTSGTVLFSVREIQEWLNGRDTVN